MTATTPIDYSACPRLRPEVRLGPAMRQGSRVVHHVSDTATGWFYRVGPREYFILSRLDGQHSLKDIARDYATTFGRRLGEANWTQLFGLLDQRQLLAGRVDDDELGRLRERRAEEERTQSRRRSSWLSRRWVVLRPDQALGRLAARMPVLFSPWFVWPGLVAVVATEALLFANIDDLYRDLRSGRGAAEVLFPVVLATWVVHVVHECAHGVTCKWFGGRVPEIGVLWRFPLLVPYCRTEDVALFRTRRQRVLTAFAGVFSSLLLAVPFAMLWWSSPPGNLRAFAAAMLLTCGLGQLANFVPFLRLDGYYMLTYALNLVDLRGDAYRLWGHVRRRDWAALRGYRRRERWIYGIYGLTTVAFATALSAFLAVWWYGNLRRWMSPSVAIGLLAAEAALIATFVVVARRRVRGSPQRRHPA